MPGVYEYAEDETIEDFILQAGGLTDAASTARVDVSRRISDPKATKASDEIATMFSFVGKNLNNKLMCVVFDIPITFNVGKFY